MQEYIAGEGGNITINHVIKNNGCEMDGLVIMEKGKDIAPTIYLDSFYELYTRMVRILRTYYTTDRGYI